MMTHIKNKALILLSLIIAVTLWLPSDARAESPDDILVVVNFSVKIESASKAELKAIFLKKKVRWKTGLKAIPIHAKGGTSLKKAFLKRLMERDEDLEQSYWQDQKIRAGLVPPVSFTKLLKAVFNIKGSVSYVFRDMYKEGVVKIIAVLPVK